MFSSCLWCRWMELQTSSLFQALMECGMHVSSSVLGVGGLVYSNVSSVFRCGWMGVLIWQSLFSSVDGMWYTCVSTVFRRAWMGYSNVSSVFRRGWIVVLKRSPLFKVWVDGGTSSFFSGVG